MGGGGGRMGWGAGAYHVALLRRRCGCVDCRKGKLEISSIVKECGMVECGSSCERNL